MVEVNSEVNGDKIEGGKQPICLFRFVYTRRRPQSIKEYNSTPEVERQLRSSIYFCRAHGYEIVDSFPGYTTSTRSRIDRNEDFKRALLAADRRGCPLLIADFFGALRRLSVEEGTTIFEALRTSDVPIFDARTGHHLQSVADSVAHALLVGHHGVHQVRSEQVKAGIRITAGDRLKRADRSRAKPLGRHLAAIRLEPMISEIETTLAAGTPLTPTILARELDARGELPTRGATWSRSSAKRLLEEVRQVRQGRKERE